MRLALVMLLPVARLLTLLSLLLAAALTLFALTSAQSLWLRHGGAGGSVRCELAPEAFWYFRLVTHPSDRPPRYDFADPPLYSVGAQDAVWQTRIHPTQTGPVRAGFASHVRRARRTEAQYDPRTHQRIDVQVVEEERIVRIPTFAIIGALLIPAAAEMTVSSSRRVRRHRRRRPNTSSSSSSSSSPPSPRSVPAAIATRLLESAAILSLALFALATSLAVTATHTFSFNTDWGSPVFDRPYTHRDLLITRAAFQFNYATNATGLASHDEIYRTIGRTDPFSRIITKPTTPPQFLGFGLSREDTRAVTPRTGNRAYYAARAAVVGRIITIPNWFFIPFTLTPALAYWYVLRRPIRRRQLRQRRGLCLTCGYDLRGSASRCPECGAPAAAR